MKVARLLLLATLLWAGPLLADEPPESAWGRTVAEVEILGARTSSIAPGDLPVARGAPLRRDDVRRSLEVLHASGRFSRVSARALPARGGAVQVVFHVEPIRRVLRVSFVGARHLQEEHLRRAADLPTGAEFTPDDAQRAATQIAHAYFRAGWRDAFVRWDATRLGDEIAVTFSLAEGEPTLLRQLNFEGRRGLSDAELRSVLGLRTGATLSLDQLDRGAAEVQRRLRQRGFYRARVGRPTISVEDRQASVRLPVEAGPFHRLRVRGNRTFDEAFLLERMGYSGEESLDEPLVRELTARLRTIYELAGFPEASVEIRETSRAVKGAAPPPKEASRDWAGRRDALPPPPTPPPSEERLITFLVREGEPMRVIQRVFEGATYFPRQELEARVEAVLVDAVPPELVGGLDAALLKAARIGGRAPDAAEARRRVNPREVYAERPYRVAASLLTDLYKAEGFLDASVGPAQLERIGPGLARVIIPVREGRRTIVSEVRLEGTSAVPADRVRKVISVRRGDPLSFFAIEESRTAITQFYQSEGHLYVQVEDDEELPRPGRPGGATVTFRVNEGPVTRVSSVEVRGLSRTDPAMVRQALALREGDPLTPQGRQQTARNLFRLGLFSSVVVEPSEPDVVAEDKALMVEVRERPYASTELRAGFSLADGPRLGAQLTRANLGGRNRTFSAGAKLNWPIVRYHLELPEACTTCELPDDPIERRVNLSLNTPYYRGDGQPPVDMRVDGIHEHLLRPAYQLTKFSALGSVDGLLRRRFGRFELSTLLQGELEQATFAHRTRELRQRQVFVTLADRQALLLPEGSILLASLRPSITLDGRDDKLNPTSGLVGSVMLDFSKSIVAQKPAPLRTPFDIALIRALVSVSGYVPLYRPQRVVFAVSGRMGAIAKTDDSQVIGTKRFFLGGTQSLRGFNEDLLVPEDLRTQIREAVNRCNSLVSPAACDENVRQVTQGVFPISQGGEFMVAGRAELRFGLTGSLDGGLFVDAGNLWLDPRLVELRRLRYAGGAGLRFALPIGPAAFDVGVNPDPDPLVGEPSVRLHLSIGLF